MNPDTNFDTRNTERRYVLIAEDSILGADQELTPEVADILNQKMAARGEKQRWQAFGREEVA